ncbi:MAG: DUF4433 domain-containing protein [Planctomycetes bacterium]|nr:DUF4433 domain-containing protein [Planctomycetota bacterium]
MQRSDVAELHYITPIDNVLSILEHGILSNKLANSLPHKSVSIEEIQNRRKNKRIPGAGHLHDYVNLYLDAHNPMLSKVRSRNDSICILCVDPGVLDLPNVIIADRNAASDYARFDPPNQGLAVMDKGRVFSQYWTHSENQYDEWTHKSIKCAEVLVPEKVESNYIIGGYVANDRALASFTRLDTRLTVCIRNDIFF